MQSVRWIPCSAWPAQGLCMLGSSSRQLSWVSAQPAWGCPRGGARNRHRSFPRFWLHWDKTFFRVTNPEMVDISFPYPTICQSHSKWHRPSLVQNSSFYPHRTSDKILDIHSLSRLEISGFWMPVVSALLSSLTLLHLPAGIWVTQVESRPWLSPKQ